ncbi:unnamed protein product [Gulo gulo]|uniref:Uncharacterized protein n=1 Tax=Gulo gulo TaxID=48420 RepID=A0A9X9Q6X5_GULGU|nr:unnamed protein product [Gulo gulo]
MLLNYYSRFICPSWHPS